MIYVQEDPFDAGAALNRFCQSTASAGAVVSFTGKVRDATTGRDVTTLLLEHYPGFTEKALAQIEAEARRRWTLEDALIIHRFGKLAPADNIVFVATAAAHRRDAFAAATFLMDYLKTDAPFWKKETGPDGARWIEPTDDDQRARASWAGDKLKERS